MLEALTQNSNILFLLIGVVALIVVIFGIMGVLGSAQAAFAVIPTRLDLLWLLAIHLVPAVLFLVVGIRAFRNRPKTMVIPVQSP